MRIAATTEEDKDLAVLDFTNSSTFLIPPPKPPRGDGEVLAIEQLRWVALSLASDC